MKLYGIDRFKLTLIEAEVSSEDENWYYLPIAGSEVGLSSSIRKGYEHKTPESAIEAHYKRVVLDLKHTIRNHATMFALMQAHGLKPNF